MKVKAFLTMFTVLAAFLLTSCNSVVSPLKSNDTPELFPIGQNRKVGYMNRKGEVVIQPQFSGEARFFSEGLAAACIEDNKCGYIDETGKFVINPQFERTSRFSEGLAAVQVGEKVGYIDKTGKFAVNPQFESGDMEIYGTFSEGLAGVKVGDKHGFIDKTGRIVINPQFEFAFPFTEGLAAVEMGSKWGFVDNEGKITINPQFDEASPFINDLAAVKIRKQYGYVDKTGKIVINPQFDDALPFSNEGLAMIKTGGKVGFVDKEGKYVINPQFVSNGSTERGLDNTALIFLAFKELGKLSFSEGLAPVKIGNNSGYIDKTGKIVINPQFRMALPFYGGLALVDFDSSPGEMAWIDKEGKIVWRETKEASKKTSQTNTNMTVPSENRMTNANMMSGSEMRNVNMMNTNTMGVTDSNSMSNSSRTNYEPQSSSRSDSSGRTGRLTTDANIRSEANKDAASLGIHFRGARVKILDETSFEADGKVSTWYKVRVVEYGCSRDANLGCGKNSSNDADEGWVNAKSVLPD